MCVLGMYPCTNILDVLDVPLLAVQLPSCTINNCTPFDVDRLSISPRKQLWIKAVKKLTSERLGREGLAAWEDRKSNNDPEVPDINETTEATEDAEISAEPDAILADQPVDAEAQTQRGPIIVKSLSFKYFIHPFYKEHVVASTAQHKYQ